MEKESYLESSTEDSEEAANKNGADAAYVVGYGATQKGTDAGAEIIDGYDAALVGGLCNHLSAVALNVADVHHFLGAISIDQSLWLLSMHTR